MKSFALLTLGTLVLFTATAHAAPVDTDRDGIPNSRDTDIDNDGLRNGVDPNVDGGVAKSGRMRGRFVGDRLTNADVNETDIDGDGLLDGSIKETDIDGDRVVNAKDKDMDGDGVLNNRDSDMNGDSYPDLIDITNDNGNGTFLIGDEALPVTKEVSLAMVETLAPPPDALITVKAYQVDPTVGVWSVLTADRLLFSGSWKIDANAPGGVNLFYLASSPGENRFYGQYPFGPFTFYNWLDGEPVGFSNSALQESPSGEPIPGTIFESFFAQNYPGTRVSTFAGNLGTIYFFDGQLGDFNGLAPFITQQRGLSGVLLQWQSSVKK